MVLKQMRLSSGLSMKKAGDLMGKSDSYIAHLETGRMDIPKGDKLDRILAAYGGIKQKSFYERVRSFVERPNDITILRSLLERANPEQLERIAKFAEATLAGLI